MSHPPRPARPTPPRHDGHHQPSYLSPPPFATDGSPHDRALSGIAGHARRSLGYSPLAFVPKVLYAVAPESMNAGMSARGISLPHSVEGQRGCPVPARLDSPKTHNSLMQRLDRKKRYRH